MRIVCSLVIDVLKLSDLISNLWTSDTCKTEISWGLKWRPLLCKTAYFFFLLVYNIYNFFWKPSNWLVVFVAVLLKHPQKEKIWERVTLFWNAHVLSAPKGHYALGTELYHAQLLFGSTTMSVELLSWDPWRQ